MFKFDDASIFTKILTASKPSLTTISMSALASSRSSRCSSCFGLAVARNASWEMRKWTQCSGFHSAFVSSRMILQHACRAILAAESPKTPPLHSLLFNPPLYFLNTHVPPPFPAPFNLVELSSTRIKLLKWTGSQYFNCAIWNWKFQIKCSRLISTILFIRGRRVAAIYFFKNTHN